MTTVNPQALHIHAAIHQISPSQGPTTGRTRITIKGTGFAGASAVIFGVVGATPISVSDTEIVVDSPAMSVPGEVSVSVISPLVPPIVRRDGFQYVLPVVKNVLFVIDNQTGVPDDYVFVKFLGAPINVDALPQTYGDGHALATGKRTASQSSRWPA